MALSKAEEIERMVAAAVNAGVERHLESVDFSDPNRPKTCLEVDFPILKINALAGLEARSGAATKPIYQEMKWWARRQSSVFRSTLIAAAAKSPNDPAEAAKLVWENYYANHQKNGAFKNLKVADIFMGGGTTLVEGARLGMQMYGNDLNPVAWLVVKNELANVDLEEVKRLFAYIEAEVKPQIMPFYACEGPNGEKGTWIHIDSRKKMGDDFDPLAVPPEERKQYRYEGPEVIYTFWAKHGPCSAPGCDHRTPLFSSPVIAVKELSVKAWENQICDDCGNTFDIEAGEARMAPDEALVHADESDIYTVLQGDGTYYCPHCGKKQINDLSKVKAKNKKVSLSLLIHPDWMKGAPGKDAHGMYGGTSKSKSTDTIRWNIKRLENLKIVEVRGCDEDALCTLNSDYSFSTMPVNAQFVCQNETCGKMQRVLDSIKESGKTGPLSPYALQCYSEVRKKSAHSYGGRYFKSISKNDIQRLNAALTEWETRSISDLNGYWSTEAVPTDGLKTAELTNQNYDFWHNMFGARQLLVNSLLLKSICTAEGFSQKSKLLALGALQQYLRSNCGFTIYHKKNDQASKVLSNNNFHSKNNLMDVPVFSDVGDGSWKSAIRTIESALEWKTNPWDLVLKEHLEEFLPDLAQKITGQSQKVYPGDELKSEGQISCGSSSLLTNWEDSSIDMVITDPPFGNNINYAELSDFFYPWMKLGVSLIIPSNPFTTPLAPKTLEAVTNPKRNPEDPDGFYRTLLTACWKEAYRVLKRSGLMAFTFHHSEDEPWVDVLESLFNAGFYLEATYPIRSDQTKGEKAQYGSQKIEYDIIHVCRKRTEEPTEISWPKLRRQILRDVRQLQDLLEHHQRAGLPEADIEVIKRGKALEYFSRHYGKVYVEEGREFTVKEALAGINEIIQDQSGSDAVKAPDKAEPLTRQFLRIFADKEMVERDQMQKFLRGSGVGPSDFLTHGWCKEVSKPQKGFAWSEPLEIAKVRKNIRSLRRDMDQALFLIGSCIDGSGINAKKEMNSGDFKPHPALGELLSWLALHGPAGEFRNASQTARQLFNSWTAENQAIMTQQLSLFDLAEE